MRIPKYLSYSGLGLYEKDPDEFYLRYLAEHRAPRIAQEQVMSVGAAFDAYVKAALHERLFGKGSDPKYTFEAMFESQVEVHNRDWAHQHGAYIMAGYQLSGAFDDLLLVLSKAKEAPRFEFTLSGLLDDKVPFTGKPDCRFVHECGVHVILDWKVKGYCSKYGASPSKGFALIRDGYDFRINKANATKKNPEGKPSRSHNSAHELYMGYDHHGMSINRDYMEHCNREYADQLSLYGWMLGEKVGDENVVCCIDEIVAAYQGPDIKPLLRVANHRARVSTQHQKTLLERTSKCWEAITSGHVFTELSREESDANCETLEQMSLSLQSGGALDDWFNKVTRPKFF